MDDPRKERLHALRAAFQRAHARGMAGFGPGNLDAFGRAIRQEREIISERRELIEDEQTRRDK